MEGDLEVPQGSTLVAGFDLTMPGGHPSATVSFLSPAVSFAATCASGTAGSATIEITIPDTSYVVDAGSSDWYPSGDQHDASTYQGSAVVPTFCDPGALVRLQFGGTFSTWITSTDTQDALHVRWHYSGGGAGGWSATYNVTPS